MRGISNALLLDTRCKRAPPHEVARVCNAYFNRYILMTHIYVYVTEIPKKLYKLALQMPAS
jgi:hypothetical protein